MQTRRLVADSDCERVRRGPVAQPVNTVTSLAYVAAGGWVAARHRATESDLALPVAAALALNGLGSAAYHGPGGRGGKWLHDTGLVSVNATLALAGLARWRGWDRRRIPGLGVALVGAAAGALALRPQADLILAGPLAAVAGVGELLAPGRRGRGRRLAGAALLGAGVAIYARSRTGGPWCRPDGPFHGHGLWHVLSAAGLALVADAALLDAADDAGTGVREEAALAADQDG